MKVVLFDIDGTILSSDGAGRGSMEGALKDVFGTSGPDTYRYDGKTDPQIARELMLHEGFQEDHIEREIPNVLERYITRLRVALGPGTEPPTVYAGVVELMDALQTRDDVLTGLLTGNIRDGAMVKLSAAGLDPNRFTFGAFGSDHHHRPELPAIARRRAAEIARREIHGSRVVIIGDTPADIYCGLGIGARALAVATGRYSHAELSECAPAAVFHDLSETDDVVAAIDRITGNSPANGASANA